MKKSDVQITSLSVTFLVKVSNDYQSYGIGVTEDAVATGEISAEEMALEVGKDAISNVGKLINHCKDRNPTFASCVAKHKSVGKRFKKLQESED